MAHASFSRTRTRPQPASPAAGALDSTLPHFRPKPETRLEPQSPALAANAIDSAAAAAAAPRLLKPKDVAERLAVTERTLERWRASGEGPAFLSLTRATVRYTSEAVDAFLQTRVRANTAQR